LFIGSLSSLLLPTFCYRASIDEVEELKKLCGSFLAEKDTAIETQLMR